MPSLRGLPQKRVSGMFFLCRERRFLDHYGGHRDVARARDIRTPRLSARGCHAHDARGSGNRASDTRKRRIAVLG